MGTWDSGGFENDAATDFLGVLTSTEDLERVFAKRTPGTEEPTESDAAQQIVVAAECVAAMLGRPAPDLPQGHADRITALGAPDEALVETAREAISGILYNSELLDLWAEDNAEPWNVAMTGLIDRLNPDIPFNPSQPRDAPQVKMTCSFCNKDIEEAELYMFSVSHETDIINTMDRSFWCHLACLNGKLHPRHLIQNWKFDPESL